MNDKNDLDTDAVIVSGTGEEYQAIDLDRIFAEVGPGYRAIIRRIQPTWCDGTIDTIELDPREPLSMDFLATEYGGRKLQIIIHDQNGKYVTARTVKFPHPPRHEGRQMIREPSEVQGQQQQGGSALGEMREIFQLMITSQQSQTKQLADAISTRLDRLETRPETTSAAAPKNTFREGLNALREIETFRDEFGLGGTQQPPPPEEESTISKAIDKFTDLMIEKEHAKIEASIHQQKQPAQLPTHSTYTPPQQQQQPQQQPTPAQIQHQIASLDDATLAAHLKTRLQSMAPHERNHAINAFLDQLGDLDDQEEDEDDHTGEVSPADLNSVVRVLDGGIHEDNSELEESDPGDIPRAPA